MTPAKSSSSKKSEKASDEDVDEDEAEEQDDDEEEDSHLLTITERTYEESCTNLNASPSHSQVSLSQMMLDDIK